MEDYPSLLRMSEDICYICLEKENKKRRGLCFFNTQCGCSAKIHRKCFDAAVMTTGVCSCGVCKREIIDICPETGMRIIYGCINDINIIKYTVSAANEKEGLYHVFDKETGEVIVEATYSAGKLHGEMNIWTMKGELRCTGNWIRGGRQGAWYIHHIITDDDMFGDLIELVYNNNEVIIFRRYNYRNELVEEENYGSFEMREMARELGAELDDITKKLI